MPSQTSEIPSQTAADKSKISQAVIEPHNAPDGMQAFPQTSLAQATYTGVSPQNLILAIPHFKAARRSATDRTYDHDEATAKEELATATLGELNVNETLLDSLAEGDEPEGSQKGFEAVLRQKVNAEKDKWTEFEKRGKNRPQLDRQQIKELEKLVAEQSFNTPDSAALRLIAVAIKEITTITEARWQKLAVPEYSRWIELLNTVGGWLTQASADINQIRSLDNPKYWQQFKDAATQEIFQLTAEYLLTSEQQNSTSAEDKKATENFVKAIYNSASINIKSLAQTILEGNFEDLRSNMASLAKTAYAPMKEQIKTLDNYLDVSREVVPFSANAPTLVKKTPKADDLPSDLLHVFQHSKLALLATVTELKAIKMKFEPYMPLPMKIHNSIERAKKGAQHFGTKLADEPIEILISASNSLDRLASNTAAVFTPLVKTAFRKTRIAMNVHTPTTKSEASDDDLLRMYALISAAPLGMLNATQSIQEVTTHLMNTALLAEKHSALQKNELGKPAKNSSAINGKEHSESSFLVDDALTHDVTHALQFVLETLCADRTKNAIKRVKKTDDSKEATDALKNAVLKAHAIATLVEIEASEDAVTADLEKTFSSIPESRLSEGKARLLSLADSLRPAVVELMTATAELKDIEFPLKLGSFVADPIVLRCRKVLKLAARVKDRIKLATTDLTGAPLNNYSRLGILAKDIGHVIAEEKNAYLKDYPDNPDKNKEVDEAVGKMLRRLQGDFTSDKDPDAVVLGKWVDLAIHDAENDSLYWPETIEQVLAQSPKISEYLHQWGEKKLFYNSIVVAMAGCLQTGHEALDRLASISPRKNYLRPRLRYFKIIFAPLIIMWGIRKLKKGTRPGQDPTLAIEDYVGREVQKLAFRIVTSVLPSGFNTALAGLFFMHGLYKGGENRSKFLERVKKRAMGDITFAGMEQPFLKYSSKEKDAGRTLKNDIQKLQEAAAATKSVPLKKSVQISAELKTEDQESVKPPLIIHPAASIAPPSAQPLNMNEELPQGDEPAYQVRSEPAENTVPALVHAAPPLQKQETVEFPEYEEQEQLKRSIQVLKQKNLQLSSKINSNTETITAIGDLENPFTFSRALTINPLQIVNEQRIKNRRLKADNHDFQMSKNKNGNEIIELEVKINTLEPKVKEQRELVDLRLAYITHIKEGLRLKALGSKYEKKLKKVQLEIKNLEANKSGSSNHARTANRMDAALETLQADSERRLKQINVDITTNATLASMTYKQYIVKLHAYRANNIPDSATVPLENDTPITLSSNEILDMSARQSKPLDKDDESTKSYIGNTVKIAIANKVGIEDAAKIKLTDSFTVNTAMRTHATSTYGNGGAEFAQASTTYSLTNVALGTPWREESTFTLGSTRVHNITPNQEGTPASVVAALKSGAIRDGIAQKFLSDLMSLKDDDEAKIKYGAYAKQQTSAILLANMEGPSSSEKHRMSKLAWNGFLDPQPFKFNGKVLPGVVAYGTEDKMLLVSYEHNTSFIYTKNDENKLMWQFISPHLSVFDVLAAQPSDKSSPKESIGLAAIDDYPTDPRIGVGETSELEAALWAAKIEQMKSNLDGFVYTTSEQSSDRKIAYTKSILQIAEFATLIALLAVPTVPQTLLGIFFGLGFGAAGEVVERINMANTDQGDSYRSSEESIETGRILLALGVLPEVWMGRKVLINTVGNTSTRLSNIYNKASKLAKERVAARKLTPKEKSVLSAKYGAGNSLFKNRIYPINTSRQGAVLNLQVQSGVITPEVAAAQGVSADTFLSGTTKEVESASQFIAMTPGSRMIIRNTDNTAIFTGMNLGEGKVAGINNTLINPEQADNWVTIDLTDAEVITHSQTGWTLKSSNANIKLVTEVEASDVKLNNTTLSAANDTDSMLPSTKQAAVTQLPTHETPIPLGTSVVTDLEDPLKSSMTTMLDILKSETAIKSAMDTPAGTVSRSFLGEVRTRLLKSDIGMTNVQYRVVYFLSESDPHTHMRHIVITGEKDGQRYVFDLTARRLGNLNIAAIDDPVILTEAQWLEKYRSFDGDLMIKYTDTSSPALASSRFNSPPPPSLSGSNEDSTLNLTEPTWFKALISPSYVTDTASSMANLTPEEAVLFKALSDHLTKRNADSRSKYIDRLLNNPQPIATGEQLRSIPASQVVVISDGDLHHHVLFSMGNGNFAAHSLDAVDTRLPMSNGIVTADTLEKKMIQGKIGKFSIASGEINKNELTFESFLGKGSRIIKGANNQITIEIIRLPGTDDPLYTFLNSSVLEHLWNARGLFLKTDATFGATVTYLVSSYVERDNEPPIVQALSNHLNSEVTHRNFRNKVTTTYRPQTQNPE